MRNTNLKDHNGPITNQESSSKYQEHHETHEKRNKLDIDAIFADQKKSQEDEVMDSLKTKVNLKDGTRDQAYVFSSNDDHPHTLRIAGPWYLRDGWPMKNSSYHDQILYILNPER